MLRIGIIGTDQIARLHVGTLLTDNKFEIAGCYAAESRESMLFARQYRLVSYSSLEALFKYTDAIDIAGDSSEIFTLAEKSLKKLKHVYIAQPDRLSLSEIGYLVKLAEESGTVLQFGAGYRDCPVYDMLAEVDQTPKLIDIKHQFLNTGAGIYSQLNIELMRDLDFITGLMQADITGKANIKSWNKSEGCFDMLHCRLDCNNGASINIVMQTISEGEPKLEMIFNFSDTVVTADIFKSVAKKQYRRFDVEDSIILDAYNEKAIHKKSLKNFYLAVNNDSAAGLRIEEQLRCFSVGDYIVERIKQSQSVTVR